MIALTGSLTSSPLNNFLHQKFLALLPRIERHAQFSFRMVRCAVRRKDAVQECLALAWKWFVRLHERGKNIDEFVQHFVVLVAKAVKSGRRLSGMAKSKDVMNEYCQARHGFKVETLPVSSRAPQEQLYAQPRGQAMHDALEERLQDNMTTPVPEQVAFRIDWPDFFATLTARDRQLAEYLALGNRGTNAAAKFRLSRARVTQLRQQWRQEWRRFEEADILA